MSGREREWTLLIGPAGIGVLPGEYPGYEGVERVVVVPKSAAREDTEQQEQRSGCKVCGDEKILMEPDGSKAQPCYACQAPGTTLEQAARPYPSGEQQEQDGEPIFPDGRRSQDRRSESWRGGGTMRRRPVEQQEQEALGEDDEGWDLDHPERTKGQALGERIRPSGEQEARHTQSSESGGMMRKAKQAERWLHEHGLEALPEAVGSREITLTADELDELRSGRGCVSRDGVYVYFD